MQPELYRQLGKIHAREGNHADAREAWEQALQIAQTQGHLVCEIRTRCARREAGDFVRLREIRDHEDLDLGPWERRLLEEALS